MTITDTTFNVLLLLMMGLIKQFIWKPWIRKTFNPQVTQQALLMRILQANKDTVFGKEHNFANIKSYEDFKQTVPVQSYEDLRPYIEKQEQQQKNYLNTSKPLMYAQTSGTTGKPKYIPILKSTVATYRQSQYVFSYATYHGVSGVYDGKVLVIVSPAVEGRLETGTPYGSMSGLIYQSMPRVVFAKYVVPPKIFDIRDYDLKYYLLTVFALAERDITLIATANPSTLLTIHNVIHDCWDKLIADVASGHHYGLKANPKRAKALTALKSDKETLIFTDLWPHLKTVITWTGGNCSLLIPSVEKLLLPSIPIVEMGYLASEFRGSITVDVRHNKSVPTINENFFEFVDRDLWGSARADFLTLDELAMSKQYYVFVTTQNGLYRYFINDIIQVDGLFNKTPTIRFVQKGKGVTNLTGEKLYESQVNTAIQLLKEALNIQFDFFMMLGASESLQYYLYIESESFIEVAKRFEKHLNKLNIEFEAKRQSGRLKQTSVMFLASGTRERYKKHCVETGQKEGQFKMVQLQYKHECTFSFDEYVRE